MANDLTGDFDVVAQFALPAVNRVLAAMHRNHRFPHSLSVQVDDRPPKTLVSDVPTIFSVVDRYGEALSDPSRLVEASGRAQDLVARSVGAGRASAVDPLVNADGWAAERVDASERAVTGIAHVQLSAPELDLPDGSQSRIKATTHMRVRYFPAPDSKALPQWMQGEIRISADVDRVASQAGTVFAVNMKAGTPTVEFAPAWGDPVPSTGQKHAIDDAIHRAVTTGFVPSNAVLPSGRNLQFKTLPGARPAVGVLMNLSQERGDPSSVAGVFLTDGADFSYAAGRDFVVRRFTALVDEALTARGRRQFSWSFPVVARVLGVEVGRRTVTYNVTLRTVAVDLHDGYIRLTAHGSASSLTTGFPSFNFRADQDFTLALDDATANLALKGSVQLHVLTGGLEGFLVNLFKGRAESALDGWIDQALADVQPDVRRTLDAQLNVGEVVGSLMSPTGGPGLPAAKDPGPDLTYTGYEIRSTGLLFHGTLDVAPWPPVHVDFEATPWTVGTSIHELSALKSWIPGGTIVDYVWRLDGRQLKVDPNTFFYSDAPSSADLVAMTPYGFNREAIREAAQAAEGGNRRVASFGVGTFCLTVNGKRLSASGPVVEESVSATACRVALGATLAPDRPLGAPETWPALAVTRPSPAGGLEIVGHASPWLTPRAAQGDSPNLVVHFADEAGRVSVLGEALRLAGRTDAATAIVAVVPAGALARMRRPEGAIVTDDPGRAWERLLAVERRPATVLLTPTGDVAWRHDGEIEAERLAVELRQRLVPGGVVEPRVFRARVAPGQTPPDFLFSYAPGRELTLRRLAGRAVVIVFWKSTLEPSLDSLRRVAADAPAEGSDRPVILAVHDGGSAEEAERAFVATGVRAILVPDPRHEIAAAYGVSVWPTIVSLDASGSVRDVGYGGSGRAR